MKQEIERIKEYCEHTYNCKAKLIKNLSDDQIFLLFGNSEVDCTCGLDDTLAKLATPQINLDEVEKLVMFAVSIMEGKTIQERFKRVEDYRKAIGYSKSDLSPSKPGTKVTTDNWISVDERLPEDGQRVLIFIDHGDASDYEEDSVEIAIFVKHEKYFDSDGDYYYLGDVSHWQQFVSPSKPGNNGCND